MSLYYFGVSEEEGCPEPENPVNCGQTDNCFANQCNCDCDCPCPTCQPFASFTERCDNWCENGALYPISSCCCCNSCSKFQVDFPGGDKPFIQGRSECDRGPCPTLDPSSCANRFRSYPSITPDNPWPCPDPGKTPEQPCILGGDCPIPKGTVVLERQPSFCTFQGVFFPRNVLACQYVGPDMGDVCNYNLEGGNPNIPACAKRNPKYKWYPVLQCVGKTFKERGESFHLHVVPARSVCEARYIATQSFTQNNGCQAESSGFSWFGEDSGPRNCKTDQWDLIDRISCTNGRQGTLHAATPNFFGGPIKCKTCPDGLAYEQCCIAARGKVRLKCADSDSGNNENMGLIQTASVGDLDINAIYPLPNFTTNINTNQIILHFTESIDENTLLDSIKIYPIKDVSTSQITINGSPTNGSFQIKALSNTSFPIFYNATDNDVKNTISFMQNAENIYVEKTGSTWNIQSNFNELSVTNVTLNNGATITVTNEPLPLPILSTEFIMDGTNRYILSVPNLSAGRYQLNINTTTLLDTSGISLGYDSENPSNPIEDINLFVLVGEEVVYCDFVATDDTRRNFRCNQCGVTMHTEYDRYAEQILRFCDNPLGFTTKLKKDFRITYVTNNKTKTSNTKDCGCGNNSVRNKDLKIRNQRRIL